MNLQFVQECLKNKPPYCWKLDLYCKLKGLLKAYFLQNRDNIESLNESLEDELLTCTYLN